MWATSILNLVILVFTYSSQRWKILNIVYIFIDILFFGMFIIYDAQKLVNGESKYGDNIDYEDYTMGALMILSELFLFFTAMTKNLILYTLVLIVFIAGAIYLGYTFYLDQLKQLAGIDQELTNKV